jgi:hypothetical protein
LGIPRSLGWLVVTGAIVAGLVGLSYLALDKANVVWRAGKPACPHCRTAVPDYAHRCPTCREEFDWVVSPEEDSPWCAACVTKPEMERMLTAAKSLGEAGTAARLSKAFGLPEPAARAWWKAIEPGRCGWCGGTGKDLAATGDAECPVCFGGEACIGCDGDLFTRLGSERAARDRDRMHRELRMVPPGAERAGYWREHRIRAKDYLRRHAGTAEAMEVAIDPQNRRPHTAETSAATARARVEAAVRALAE